MTEPLQLDLRRNLGEPAAGGNFSPDPVRGFYETTTPIMKLSILLFLLAITLLGVASCAQYGDNAMAGAAVDMPNPTPVLDEPSVLTGPSPSPSPAASTGQQLPGR